MKLRHNLNRIAYFVAVFEEHTITAAAERLGVSKAVVSKQLLSLEEELGVSLLARNTRRVTPTAAGVEFYERGQAALIQANDAFEAVRDQDGTPRGRLRVTAPVDYGLMYVTPLISRYRAAFPKVAIELSLSDEQQDLIEARYDVAFRVGWLKDSSNRARKLREFKEVAFCPPQLLKDARIDSPKDLESLPFIANSVLSSPTRWTFRSGRKSRDVTFRAALTVNNTAAIRAVVLQSATFSILPDFLLADDFDAGRLVQLLPKWSLRTGAIYTVCPPGRTRGRAIQSFLDMAHAR